MELKMEGYKINDTTSETFSIGVPFDTPDIIFGLQYLDTKINRLGFRDTVNEFATQFVDNRNHLGEGLNKNLPFEERFKFLSFFEQLKEYLGKHLKDGYAFTIFNNLTENLFDFYSFVEGRSHIHKHTGVVKVQNLEPALPPVVSQKIQPGSINDILHMNVDQNDLQSCLSIKSISYDPSITDRDKGIINKEILLVYFSLAKTIDEPIDKISQNKQIQIGYHTTLKEKRDNDEAIEIVLNDSALSNVERILQKSEKLANKSFSFVDFIPLSDGTAYDLFKKIAISPSISDYINNSEKTSNRTLPSRVYNAGVGTLVVDRLIKENKACLSHFTTTEKHENTSELKIIKEFCDYCNNSLKKIEPSSFKKHYRELIESQKGENIATLSVNLAIAEKNHDMRALVANFYSIRALNKNNSISKVVQSSVENFREKVPLLLESFLNDHHDIFNQYVKTQFAHSNTALMENLSCLNEEYDKIMSSGFTDLLRPLESLTKKEFDNIDSVIDSIYTSNTTSNIPLYREYESCRNEVELATLVSTVAKTTKDLNKMILMDRIINGTSYFKQKIEVGTLSIQVDNYLSSNKPDKGNYNDLAITSKPKSPPQAKSLFYVKEKLNTKDSHYLHAFEKLKASNTELEEKEYFKKLEYGKVYFQNPLHLNGINFKESKLESVLTDLLGSSSPLSEAIKSSGYDAIILHDNPHGMIDIVNISASKKIFWSGGLNVKEETTTNTNSNYEWFDAAQDNSLVEIWVTQEGEEYFIVLPGENNTSHSLEKSWPKAELISGVDAYYAPVTDDNFNQLKSLYDTFSITPEALKCFVRLPEDQELSKIDQAKPKLNEIISIVKNDLQFSRQTARRNNVSTQDFIRQ